MFVIFLHIILFEFHMRITLVNKTDTMGGAAIAGFRLLNALFNSDIKVRMLVMRKFSTNTLVESIVNSKMKDYSSKFKLIKEKAFLYRHIEDKNKIFEFSLPNSGFNICNNFLIESAEIIHLHWINNGFISLKGLKQIVATRKPIVWTLHDMWAFTGGCHYSGECINFKTGCGNCKYLKNKGNKDISNKIFAKKLDILKNANITFVTCSNWLGEIAKTSPITEGHEVLSIPNAINTNIYEPLDKKNVREKLNLPQDKKLILFGAMNTNDKRKGFSYLAEALSHLKQFNDINSEEIELLVFGKANPETFKDIPFKVNYLSTLNNDNQLAYAYNAADIFVLPSLEDNLPNTIMESMSCGIPVAAFNTGGIPEMVDNKINGYIAEYKNAQDLANGIKWILYNTNYQSLSSQSREKVLNNYKMSIVAEKYNQVYKKIYVKKRNNQ